jgi:Tol biopolymer transport system component
MLFEPSPAYPSRRHHAKDPRMFPDSTTSCARRSLLAFAFALAAQLAACGGGGGGEAPAPSPGPAPAPVPAPGPAPGPAPAPAPLNGDAAGTLYFGGPGSTVAFDLATGITQVIRTQDASLMPSPGGDRFTFSADSPADRYDLDRLWITGPDGIVQAWFDVADGLRGPGQLSPDGTRVLVDWSTDDDATIYVPTVFDLTGKVLARYPGFTDYAWLPDGGLVLAKGDAIWRVGASLGAPAVIRHFPDEQPGFLSPSPDGTRLAFDLGDTGVLANHVWLMNIDGSDARQLTTSSLNEDGAGWSPDGRTLALRQGIAYAAEAGGVPGAPCPEIWLVPADATAIVALDPADATTPARRLQQLQPDGTVRGSVCAFSVPQWRVAPPALPHDDGSAFAGGGRNAGLGGRLWANDAYDDVLFDLSTGEPTFSFTEALGDWAVIAPAGDEVVVSVSDPASGDIDGDALRIVGLDGKTHSYFEVPEFLSGPPRLSPDGQTIAIAWNSEANDDPAAVDIVTLFGRDGSVKARVQDYGDWAWLPDGRLLVVQGAQVDAIDATFQHLAPVAQFPEGVDGIAVSPDGRRLAFTMASHVWTSALDGSELRQLTVSGGSESTPVWSPDGRAVAFRFQSELGGCPLVYAVPADGQRVFVGQAGVASSALPVTVDDRGTVRTLCAFSQMAWLP